LGVSDVELELLGAVEGVEVLPPIEVAPVEPLEPKLLPDGVLEPKLVLL
jgi:hypothetical protein